MRQLRSELIFLTLVPSLFFASCASVAGRYGRLRHNGRCSIYLVIFRLEGTATKTDEAARTAAGARHAEAKEDEGPSVVRGLPKGEAALRPSGCDGGLGERDATADRAGMSSMQGPQAGLRCFGAAARFV